MLSNECEEDLPLCMKVSADAREYVNTGILLKGHSRSSVMMQFNRTLYDNNYDLLVMYLVAVCCVLFKVGVLSLKLPLWHFGLFCILELLISFYQVPLLYTGCAFTFWDWQFHRFYMGTYWFGVYCLFCSFVVFLFMCTLHTIFIINK